MLANESLGIRRGLNRFLNLIWLEFLVSDQDDHIKNIYELEPVAASTPAWKSYHEIARTALFRNDEGEYYSALEFMAPYYDRMTPLLLSFNGEAIGTVALDKLGDDTAAMRMVAVEKTHQGQGHGRALGSLLIEFAKSYGIKKLCVNADSEAVGYYGSLGFAPETWSPDESEALRKNGATSIQMVKNIS